MSFISNAEMSLRILKHLMEQDGQTLSAEQEDHFKKTYAPALNNLDNDFDDYLGLPRLTEKEVQV